MAEAVKITPAPTHEQIAAMTTQAAQVPLMYFNYLRTATSFFDMRLFFGQGSLTPQGKPTFEEQLCIVVSPELAKLLRDNLSTAIATYEEKFGKLREPPAQAITNLTRSTTPTVEADKKKHK